MTKGVINIITGENHYLKLASFFTISLFEEKTNKLPSGLYFNKILSLCYTELKDEGIDIHLPHVWYRYGDEVVRYHMPHELVWNHETETLTTVDWKVDEPILDPDDTFAGRVFQKVRNLTDKYYDDITGLVKKNYSYAPFQFQRDFLNVRETFYGIPNALNFDLKTVTTLATPTLEKMLTHFPIKEFPDLEDELAIAKTFQEILLNEENPDLEIFQQFSTAFWFMFCYRLRTHNDAHENVPYKTIEYWKEQILFQKERHRRHFADLMIECAKKNEKVLEYPILKNEIEWRTNDLKEIDSLIDDFVGTLKEIGDDKCQYFGDN